MSPRRQYKQIDFPMRTLRTSIYTQSFESVLRQAGVLRSRMPMDGDRLVTAHRFTCTQRQGEYTRNCMQEQTHDATQCKLCWKSRCRRTKHGRSGLARLPIVLLRSYEFSTSTATACRHSIEPCSIYRLSAPDLHCPDALSGPPVPLRR